MPETRTRVLNWLVSGGRAKAPGGVEIAIDVDAVVVGRAPGADIVLADPEVSALHCELRAVSEGVLVKDLGSTNGTFLGTVRVREAVIATPTEIRVGGSKIAIEPEARRRVDVGFLDRFGPLVGSAPKMRRVFGILEKIAPTPLGVLILGETGTGKELVAKAIHDASAHASGPLVVVDCASIPHSLAESLLFGHEKGAFTGATERRQGALAEANGGTLFLDELGELPIEIQPKLLRALGERKIKRLGGSALEAIDARVVAATRRDLGAEMNAGRFRSDLYFRVAQVRIELPPLRERLDDVPMLVEEICRRAEKSEHAQAVLAWIEQRMASHDWPGNVRELVNVASVAAMLAGEPGAIDDVLMLPREPALADVPPRGNATAFAEAKRAAVGAFERDYFSDLARKCGGNVAEMARRSGMERHHVRAYLRKHRVDKTAVQQAQAAIQKEPSSTKRDP
jgi:DNA-binding NtrC family response regulator